MPAQAAGGRPHSRLWAGTFAYSVRMTRTGRHRASPVVRGPRRAEHRAPVPARVVAGVMMLLILAAGVLVPAGSDHHRPGSASPAAVAFGGDLAVAHPVSGHEHRHGNNWTPSLGKRLRPAADLTVVHVATAGSAGPGATVPATTAFPAAFSPGGDLTLLGVLRV